MKQKLLVLLHERPLSLALLYASLSCVWIVLSGQLVARMTSSRETAITLEITKGLLYIGTTSTLIYILLRRLQGIRNNLEDIVIRRTAELTRSEKQTRSAEEKLRDLLANLPDVTWTSAIDGSTVYISPNVEKVLGYSAEEIYAGKAPWFDNIHSDDKEKVIAAFQALFQKGHEFDQEYQFRRKDGNWIWIRDRALRTRMVEDVWYADGICTDVTEQKHAREQLLETAQRLSLAQEIASIGTFDVDLRSKRFLWSDSFFRIFGLDPAIDVPSYERWSCCLHPEDRDRAIRTFSEALRTDSYQSEYRIVRPDGTTAWIFNCGRVYHDPSGLPVRLLGVNQDITERKAGEQALLRSEQRFRNLIETAEEGVLVTDRAGRVCFANQKLTSLLGFESDEILGKMLLDIVPREERDEVAANLERRKQGIRERVERWSVRKDGTPIFLSITASPIIDHDGNFDGVLSMFTDRTEPKRTEEALRKSEERFQLSSRASRDVIWDLDIPGDKLWFSDSFWETFGYDPSSFPAGRQGWEELVHPDDRWVLPLEDAQCRTFEYRMRRADGTWAHVLDRAYLIRDSQGVPVRKVGTLSDISEVRRLQQQLLQAQKMEAIGNLAGGVAHDFNNLLMVISSHSELLLHGASDDKVKQHLHQIVEASHRAAGLTSQLLAFSRKQVVEPTVLDLNAILQDTKKMLSRLIREDVVLDLRMCEQLLPCKVDRSQMQQVIMNLAVNARDAMPNGGTLLLQTANLELKEAANYGEVVVPRGCYVVLSVVDNGTGMDEDTRARIFEPFFTTKELGRGTGLGLSTVYGIVKQNNGFIFVSSQLGVGTRFQVLLPAAVGEALVGESVSEGLITTRMSPHPVPIQATVLFVEDEPSLRDAGAEFLSSCGYRVLTASNGEDALRVSEEFSEDIDALVTDVIMPKMRGTELAKSIATRRPNIRVLYMSGYFENAEFQADPTSLNEGYLWKPFSFRVLAERLTQMLKTS